MALNEMIAQGAQFKMPDPLEQYGRIAQIQQAQNQNALAQYQINSAKRADETNTNFLSSLRVAGDDPAKVRQALMMAGKVKEAGEFDVSALTRQKTQNDIRRQQRENVDRMKLDLSKNPSNENITAYMQDIDDDPTFSPSAKAIAKRGLNEMLGMTVDQRKQSLLTSGMSGSEMATADIAQKKLVAPDPFQIERADGSKIFVDKNPNSPTFKQEILPSQAAGMTPTQAGTLKVAQQQLGVSQGNLKVAQQRLAQDAQGVTYQQDAQGNIIALPSRLASGGAPVARTVAGEGGAPVKGKPSAFAEKAAAQKVQMGKDLDFAIKELSDITKDGGLIDQSTGSGAGRLIDLAAGFGGQAMPGAIAIGKIAPVADLALKMVPRFEGPQSNADTTSYNQAAGQLADPTLPREIRKEAGKTVLRLMQQRKGQFVTSNMAAEGASPAPAGNAVDTSNPLLK
jgi:hypothetical protein